MPAPGAGVSLGPTGVLPAHNKNLEAAGAKAKFFAEMENFFENFLKAQSVPAPVGTHAMACIGVFRPYTASTVLLCGLPRFGPRPKFQAEMEKFF